MNDSEGMKMTQEEINLIVAKLEAARLDPQFMAKLERLMSENERVLGKLAEDD